MAYIKKFLKFLALWRKNTSQKWYNCDIMTLHSGVSCALVKNNLLFLEKIIKKKLKKANQLWFSS